MSIWKLLSIEDFVAKIFLENNVNFHYMSPEQAVFVAFVSAKLVVYKNNVVCSQKAFPVLSEHESQRQVPMDRS